MILFTLCYLSAIITNIPKFFGVNDSRSVLRKIDLILKGHYVLIVFTALTAGVTEELIVRGYLFPRLSLLIKNKYAPIIISASVFSMFHFAYHSLDEYLFTFFFGLITALYYQKFRSIKVLIVFHFLYDLFAITIAQHFLK